MMITFQSSLSVSCFILLCWYGVHYRINGALTVSPFTRAAVCRVGDRLEVRCSTTQSALTWNLAVVGVTSTITRSLSTTTINEDIVSTDSGIFIFSRVSELRASPLVSMLEVTAVSLGLNGTRITCMELGTDTTSTGTTTVYIYRDQGYQPNPPEVDFEEEFGEERVTIFVNWTQSENPLVSYNIRVDPRSGTMVTIVDSTRANLTLSYNTPYNVTVVADFCGQRNATAQFELSYAKCEDPSDSNSIEVHGYASPALEGVNISFTCVSGLMPMGPNSSTCQSNGQWQPDPVEVACEGESFESITADTTTECLTGKLCLELNHTQAHSTSQNTGIIVGSLFAITALITSAVIAVISIIIAKNKGRLKEKVHSKNLFKTRRSETIETGGIPNNQLQTQAQPTDAQLLYADIGSSLKQKYPMMVSTLELDDTHVEYAQINHNIRNTQQETCFNITLKGDPHIIDLDKLLIQLRPQVGPKWYEFGEAAGIEREVLDNYAFHCNPEECIVEMLDYWLRNHVGKPTWKEVSNLLKAIGLGELSSDINKVYSTGRLPIEIDVNEDSNPHLHARVLFDSDHLHEVPPPIPPKTVQQTKELYPTMTESSIKAPARPP